MTPAPVAVLGWGPWGRTIAAAIDATPGISLAAIISAKPETKAAPDEALPVLRTWREAIDQAGATGIVLAVPPSIQPAIAIELIENRIPVMLEKPMAMTVEDAAAIENAARTHGFAGVVDHLHLYAPAFRALTEALAGKSGPRTVRASAGARGPYRTGWSPLWDWAGHDLAMVLSTIDSDPVEIRAAVETEIVEEGKTYRNYRIDLTFRDGTQAALHIESAFAGKTRQFCVEAGNSELCYREDEGSVVYLSVDAIERTDIETGIESRPLNAALIAFAARIEGGGGLDDVKLGTDVVRLIDAAERSAQSGDAVVPLSGGHI